MKKVLSIVGMIIFVIVVIMGCIYIYRNATQEVENNNSGDIISSGENIKSGDNIEKEYLFTPDEFPKIDGSTATHPLTDAIAKDFTGKTTKELGVEYSKTHQSYMKLIDGKVDLIAVTYPSKEEFDYAKEKGVELEVIPVVNEAFVFFTNKANPVDNLTLKQIQDIYSGKITNWKEVGGNDEKIKPYQRPVNSGSQTGMLKLVMKDIPMIEPTKDTYEETMAGIIEAVADYDNGKNSLGYSYYYYATTMYSKDNMKFIGVDGVKPTYETIKANEYPINTSYYIVINKAAPEEGNTRKLLNAMLSERGQKVAKEAGYVPVR